MYSNLTIFLEMKIRKINEVNNNKTYICFLKSYTVSTLIAGYLS